ncbi:MAG: hypothetical protein AB7S93_16740 [Xanthobacteraceae bacterium]
MQNRQIIAAGLGSALALIVCAGLKVSATPVTSAAAMSTFSASEATSQSSNRALKGDRSPLVQAPVAVSSVPRDIVVIPKLLDGCEAVISSIGNSPLAQVAGSCVS